MTLLVDITDQGWLSNSGFSKVMQGRLTSEQFRFYPDIEPAHDITMLVSDRLRPGLIKQLPNVQLVQKLGAGVDSMVFDPDLPAEVRITRLKSQATANEMARFCLAYVLKDVHNIDFHRRHQRQSKWKAIAPGKPREITIGILGLGHIGATVACLFESMGFSVQGWSRSEKEIKNVKCFSGLETVEQVLATSDFVICILPSTLETINFFNLNRFQKMKSTATLINVGRGTLVVEHDLVTALDQNCLSHAVLDVFQSEPLHEQSVLWQHPGVTVTPHVSGWDLLEGLGVIADNYIRLQNNESLLYEVDRQAGY